MPRLLEPEPRSILVLCAILAAALLALPLGAGQARAATSVYPAGGGTFTGGAQGWEATNSSCNVPALCTADGGYDGANGNPPGSIAANTTIGLNLLTLFKSTVTLQSPDFTVAGVGEATLHLERQFSSSSLVDLAPQATYDVALIDRTAGTRAEPLTEDLKEASAFIGKDHAVTVKAGHDYALSITVETSSTVAGTALLGGTTSVRFDNVSVTVQPSGGGNGSGNGSGSGGGPSSRPLQSAAAVPARQQPDRAGGVEAQQGDRQGQVPGRGRRPLPGHPAGNAQQEEVRDLGSQGQGGEGQDQEVRPPSQAEGPEEGG